MDDPERFGERDLFATLIGAEHPIPSDVATRIRLEELHSTPLPREEFERRLAEPVSEEERQRMLDLIDWFEHRFPTPGERLAYVRHVYRRWRAGEG